MIGHMHTTAVVSTVYSLMSFHSGASSLFPKVPSDQHMYKAANEPFSTRLKPQVTYSKDDLVKE